VSESTYLRNVLIVDDEELFRRSASDALQAACPDHRVRVGANGREALALCDEVPFDVLVTDISMPEMDGLELTRTLRERGFPGEIIVVTAFGEHETEAQLERYGIFGYLEKPVDLPRLIATIRAAAEGGRGGQTGLGVVELAELIEVERESGLLRVNLGARSGGLLFQDGVLLDAEHGGLRGDRAAIEVLGWDADPRLRTRLLGEVRPSRQTVTLPLADLVAEARKRRDDGSTPDRAEVARTPEKPRGTPVRKGRRPSPSDRKEANMNVKESLNTAMDIDGSIGIALVDFESGMTLGVAGGGPLDLQVAGAGNSEVVRAKMQVMRQLGLDDKVEDILISLGKQYHLIRPLATAPNLFLYLALDRSKSNLAMARHKLMALEQSLEL
jgi:CheY-like chemotaxis protein